MPAKKPYDTPYGPMLPVPGSGIAVPEHPKAPIMRDVPRTPGGNAERNKWSATGGKIRKGGGDKGGGGLDVPMGKPGGLTRPLRDKEGEVWNGESFKTKEYTQPYDPPPRLKPAHTNDWMAGASSRVTNDPRATIFEGGYLPRASGRMWVPGSSDEGGEEEEEASSTVGSGGLRISPETQKLLDSVETHGLPTAPVTAPPENEGLSDPWEDEEEPETRGLGASRGLRIPRRGK